MLSNKTKLSKDHQDTTPTKVPLCPLGWKTAPSASSFAHVHTCRSRHLEPFTYLPPLALKQIHKFKETNNMRNEIEY